MREVSAQEEDPQGVAMHNILVAGAGKIGMLVAVLLSRTADYQVFVADREIKHFDLGSANEQHPIHQTTLDITDKNALNAYIKEKDINTVISCLPFFCNPMVAELAKENHINYFDLTEDVNVSDKIKHLAQDATTAFVPQCGLAPGFISIVANELMQHFSQVNAVYMRVGALPVYPNNALKYALTWSTDGLINEYCNPCKAIVHKKEIMLQPLEGLETITIDGLAYEAFNTSGGLGTLADTYNGKVSIMNYKTLRYTGHCKKMRLLLNDLKLNEDRETLKRILENALPITNQDVVLIYVAVNGYRERQLVEETFVQKIYPKTIAGKLWSSIQVTTAASACAVIDIVLNNPIPRRGFVLQESISLRDFTNNRFGQFYL